MVGCREGSIVLCLCCRIGGYLPGPAWVAHLLRSYAQDYVTDEFGPTAFMCVSLLLRDRYFPATWLASRDAAQSASNDAAASP